MPVPQTGVADPTQSSWADQMEDLDAITPDNLPDTVEKIDGDTKTVVSYEVQDEKIVKVTREYKIERHRVPKAIASRRKWAKFGDAEQDTPEGPDPATTLISDDVFLTLTSNKEDLDQQDEDPLKKLKDQAKGMVTCRICKGDHWTTKCPYKDSLGASTLKELEEAANPKVESDMSAAQAAAPGTGKYVPPHQTKRPGDQGLGSRMGRDDDQCTVRVTNVSEDTQEGDLRDLFQHFGNIRRVFLAKDKITQHSKGFAFISYAMKEDAAKAIKNLNGFGYDHLILKVEWAKPSNPPKAH
ncbi:eukaryotic translation initiation factor 3 subunit G-like [Halichondria panicea]|uniref:eukaryotic translation initiation factor 3 subunit G-like n=1 Tax=Halichondria panicea TaxID=6063 RepID=UPI00312B51CC